MTEDVDFIRHLLLARSSEILWHYGPYVSRQGSTTQARRQNRSASLMAAPACALPASYWRLAGALQPGS